MYKTLTAVPFLKSLHYYINTVNCLYFRVLLCTALRLEFIWNRVRGTRADFLRCSSRIAEQMQFPRHFTLIRLHLHKVEHNKYVYMK